MLSGVGVICFAASYLVAFVLELTRLFFRSGARGAVMLGFAGAGLLAHSAYLYYQMVDMHGSPLSSQRDWYFIAAWVLVVLYLYLTYFHPKTPFGVFVLPLVLGLIGVGQFLADPRPFPRESASAAWGTVHGIAILLSVVSLSIGFVAALMYFVQARRLKAKRPPGGGPRLELICYETPSGQDLPANAHANTVGLRHLAFRVDDIQADYERLLAAGVKFIGPPTAVPAAAVTHKAGSKRLCYCHDPDGVLVELAEYR